MKIATYNIDWGLVYKNNSLLDKFESVLDELNADILILTETVDCLELKNYRFSYTTKPLPSDCIYEGINYFNYLKGVGATRVAIYSKYELKKMFKVSDEYTSICCEFETEIGSICIYATIIGTQFNRKPYANNELENCINDCLSISKTVPHFCLVGDLNTSFIEEEKYHEIRGINSRKVINKLTEDCNLDKTTASLVFNIDHIFPSSSLVNNKKINVSSFIEKDKLSDHQGVLVEIS